MLSVVERRLLIEHAMAKLARSSSRVPRLSCRTLSFSSGRSSSFHVVGSDSAETVTMEPTSLATEWAFDREPLRLTDLFMLPILREALLSIGDPARRMEV